MSYAPLQTSRAAFCEVLASMSPSCFAVDWHILLTYLTT